MVVQPNQRADMATKLAKASAVKPYGITEVHAKAKYFRPQLFCAANLI